MEGARRVLTKSALNTLSPELLPALLATRYPGGTAHLRTGVRRVRTVELRHRLAGVDAGFHRLQLDLEIEVGVVLGRLNQHDAENTPTATCASTRFGRGSINSAARRKLGGSILPGA